VEVEALVAQVGPCLHHQTRATNVPGILAHGLLPAEALARRAGRAPTEIALRHAPVTLASGAHQATLTHQRPLLAGRGQAFLEGHSLASWAAQLDQRVFFWPAQRGRAFAASLDGKTAVLRLDTHLFYHAFAPDIDLSPINSGNATRRAAMRGDWLYVPVSASWRDFAENRRRRGSVAGLDQVVEVSITRAIPPDLLRELLVEEPL